jgi:CBS domain-containing protein
MNKLLSGWGAGLGLALLSPALLAAPIQDMPGIFVKWSAYLFLLFAIVVAALVYFLRPREDRRASPVDKILEPRRPVRSVAPDALVTDCVRAMAVEKIGALLVMQGERLVGIFTERDALNKVLAAGLDPRSTKVAAVMTRDPQCVPPTITVGAAMELVTERRFRHLPIVENGKVRGIVSSGDLTRWLVKGQLGEAEGYVPLAARSP